MIYPIANALNIPTHRVFANNILFDKDGKYSGFDGDELTSRDGGKPAVIQRLKNDHGYTPIIMIGDGATDMQV
jgi:phosphoserine phosphatase